MLGRVSSCSLPGVNEGERLERQSEPRVGDRLQLHAQLQPRLAFGGAQETWGGDMPRQIGKESGQTDTSEGNSKRE